VAAAKASLIVAISRSVISAGRSRLGLARKGLGATIRQGPSPEAASATPSASPPCQGRWLEPLRPAWASWIAGTAPSARMNSAIRLSGAICSSRQRPVQPWVIRPSGSTPVASTNTIPAPPTASLP
jgi:hypothetical protein